MSDEIKDVNQEPVQPEGENVAPPATEQTQEPEATEVGTQQEPVEKPEVQEQVPFNEHPRFKELIQEKNWYKQQLEEKLKPQQSVPTQEQPLGATPEEREFWGQVKTVAQKSYQGDMQKLKTEYDAKFQAGQAEIARGKVSEFRRDHPDIKRNSPEEYEIAQKMNVGYSTEDAYWSVMGPRGIKTAQQTAQRVVKQQNQVKKRANVETGGISSDGMPNSVVSKDTFTADLEKAINDEGGFDQV